MALPREVLRDDFLNAGAIAGAVAGLRISRRLVNVSWQFQPTIGLVAKDIDRLGLDIRSFKEPLTRAVKRVIIPSIRKNFEVGGRPPWDSLSAATIKRRGYDAWPILVRSGALRKGATSFSIWDIGQTSAVVRKLPEKIWYGAVHQGGIESGVSRLQATRPQSKEARSLADRFTRMARRELGAGASEQHVRNRALGLLIDTSGIPARPFIMLQDDDIFDIELIFAEWLEERARIVGRFG